MLSTASEALPDTLDRTLASLPADVPTLAGLLPGQRARVLRVAMPRAGHGHDRNLVLRLLEIGFVPEESVRVVATGPGGREPIAVRVGGTMFALRRHEAEHIYVTAVESLR